MDLFQLIRNHKCLPGQAVEDRVAHLWVTNVLIRKSALVTVNENFDKFLNYKSALVTVNENFDKFLNYVALGGWKTV